MLRITVSKGSRAALNYFKEDLAQQNYYSGEAKTVGRWHGKTTKRLGLTDEVSEDQFKKLVLNRHPVTGDKITVRDMANRRVGYDFTFSVPKSVSVLFALTKDEAIAKAHRNAVEQAMFEVENNMQTQARRNGEKYYHTTSNLAYAAFEHHITRPVEHEQNGRKQHIPDPHLHIHAYVLNATWNAEKNRYQAIEISNIKRSGIYYEALYQHHLAKELQKSGYETIRTKNGFELQGVSKQIRDRYANRTKEINKAALEKGITSDKDKDQLGARTRLDKKKAVCDQAMEAHWLSRVSPEELDHLKSLKRQKDQSVNRSKSIMQNDLSVDQALDRALQHYMERKSAVPEKQILGYALKLGVDRLDLNALKKGLEARKDKDVISGEKNSDTYVTTREAWLAEQQMKDFAVNTRNRFKPLNKAYTPQRDFLNKGQRNAIHHVLNSKDQVIMVAGGAGTGKTTLMKEVKAGIESNDKQIYAFAPSADASRGVLRDKGFEQADTIKKLLDRKDLQEKTKDQVILIDEAGMIGNQTMNGIFKVAREQNARVILSGDWKQHTSVESGDSLRLLEKDSELPVSRVKEIVRQKDKTGYRKAVRELSEGELENGFKTLDKMGSVIEINDRDERHQRVAQDYYDSMTAHGVKQKDGTYRDRTALVVCPTHAEGQAITRSIRDKLKEKGMVKQQERSFNIYRGLSYTDAEKQDPLNYEEGMAVEFYQKNGAFKPGTALEVAGVDDQGKVLVKDKDNNTLSPLSLDQNEQFEVFKKETIELAQGDKVRITGNGRSQDGKPMNNGDTHHIEGFTDKGDILLKNGQTLPKDYKHFNLGYYTTSHSSQGKDADDVFICESSTSFSAANDKQFYVSVSRGVERCLIYTDDKEMLKLAVSKDGNRMSADEVVKVSRDQSAKNLTRTLIEQQQRQAIQIQLEKSSQQSNEKEKDHGQVFQFDRPVGSASKENSKSCDISL